MNEILVSKYLSIPILICVLCLIIIIYKRHEIVLTRGKNLYITVLAFFLIYLFLLGNSLFYDIYYQWDLNRYDLDKNGMFTGNEINEGQKIAMEKLTSDTARNFTFIIGIIFSSVFSLFLYAILSIISRFKRKTENGTLNKY